MRRSSLSVISVAVVGLAVAALRCTSALGIGATTPEPCMGASAIHCEMCNGYCNSVMQQCPAATGNPGPLTEYLTTDVCVQACSVSIGQWMNESNSAFKVDGDGFTCRQGFLEAGTGGSCANAGPLGGATAPGACETDPCTTFCQLELQVCARGSPQYDGGDQYDGGLTGCVQYCRKQRGWYVLPDSGNGSDLYPHTGDDTLNCRFYHLENAMKQGVDYAGGPNLHCPHTAPRGVSTVCIPPTPPPDAGVEDAAVE